MKAFPVPYTNLSRDCDSSALSPPGDTGWTIEVIKLTIENTVCLGKNSVPVILMGKVTLRNKISPGKFLKIERSVLTIVPVSLAVISWLFWRDCLCQEGRDDET